jgi:hypothetical protein
MFNIRLILNNPLSFSYSPIIFLVIFSILIISVNTISLPARSNNIAYGFIFPFTQQEPTDTNTNTSAMRSLSENQTQLKFTRWGLNENNLTITAVEDHSGVPSFRIEGTTGNAASGFRSQNLDSKTKNISLTIGEVSKSPNNPQITFIFSVIGKNGHKSLLTFTEGWLSTEGWLGTHFYRLIKPNSSYLINLNNLPVKDDYSLERIFIAVQKESTVNPIQFRIGFT